MYKQNFSAAKNFLIDYHKAVEKINRFLVVIAISNFLSIKSYRYYSGYCD